MNTHVAALPNTSTRARRADGMNPSSDALQDACDAMIDELAAADGPIRVLALSRSTA